jgi:sec-independent protein translocase protein TatC
MSSQLNSGPLAQDDPGTMSWIDHLRELRNRLIVASIAVVIGMVIGFIAVTYNNYALIDFIKVWQTPAGTVLQAVAPAEVFTNAIRVAFAIGISLAMPVVVYELLAFIVPGLTSREKKIIFVTLPFITFCFISGLAFGWFVTVPAALNFLLLQGVGNILIQPTVETFLSIFTRLMLLNGVLFEMPVIVYSLIWLGAVRRGTLVRYRRYAILLIVVIASIVTPTSDPVNLALVAVPMYLLYELGLLLALIAPRRPSTTG